MKKEKVITLCKTPWLSLNKTEHNFIFAQRRNINSTAALCFKRVKNKFYFLIRMQPLPLLNTVFRKKWDDLYPCPITGSMEKNQQPIDNAINEIYEEANIKVTKKNMVDSSFCVATTQMNETVFNFLFDVTGCKVVNKQMGDGTVFETHSKNRWVSWQELRKIVHNKDEKIYLSSLLSCFELFESNYGKIKNKH